MFGDDRLDVVDTPGLFDTSLEENKVIEEITRCISLLAPGPHVILIVLQLERFTTQEQEIVNMIGLMFGEKAGCYSMVLFANGDALQEEETSIEELIGENEALHNFIKTCDGKYHVFNNKDQDRRQVQELMQKIHKMAAMNSKTCYTNEMFQEAKKAINEEIKRLLKENPKMTLEEARKQAEESNRFNQRSLRILAEIAAGAGAGAATGAAVGALGLGVGAGPGAAVGAIAGVVVGGVRAAASVAIKEKACVIQ